MGLFSSANGCSRQWPRKLVIEALRERQTSNKLRRSLPPLPCTPDQVSRASWGPQRGTEREGTYQRIKDSTAVGMERGRSPSVPRPTSRAHVTHVDIPTRHVSAQLILSSPRTSLSKIFVRICSFICFFLAGHAHRTLLSRMRKREKRSCHTG